MCSEDTLAALPVCSTNSAFFRGQCKHGARAAPHPVQALGSKGNGVQRACADGTLLALGLAPVPRLLAVELSMTKNVFRRKARRRRCERKAGCCVGKGLAMICLGHPHLCH